MNDTRTTPKDQALQELAYAIGEDPDCIRFENPDWLKLMQKGVIIKLRIRRWRAKAKLDLADLGLADQDDSELDELINLGDKYLLPPALVKQLDSIETSARFAIEKRGFETFWGWFIPENAYPEWKSENEIWKAKYYSIRDQIVRDYDQNKADLMLAYRKAARLAYRRMQALSPERMTLAERLNEDTFVNRFIGKLSSLIPSPNRIYASFNYEADLSFIPLPSLLAADLAEAEIAQDRAYADRQATQAKLDGERKAAYEQSMMTRDVINKAAQQKEELISGFLYDILGQLRTLVYQASTDVLSSIKKNGTLQPRSIVQLRNLIDQVNNLNFFGDSEIDKMIARLRLIIDQSPDARKTNLENIEANLRDIATITRGTLLAIGETPRSPKGTSLTGLGLQDRPPADLIRQARKNLEIEPAAQPGLDLQRSARKGQ